MIRPAVPLNTHNLRQCVLCALAMMLPCAATMGAQSDRAARPGVPDASAPLYAEILFGNDRSDLQLEINRRFSKANHLSLISITSAQGEHSNSTDSFDFVNTSELSWDLVKGFGVNVGLSLNRQVGFNYTSGFQYVHSSPLLLVVVSPSVLLTGHHDVQNVVLLRYQPKLTRRWRLFEGVQVLDDYDPQADLHPRQFLHARSGATIDKFTFGIGADADWYGAPSEYRNNFGPFFSYTF